MRSLRFEPGTVARYAPDLAGHRQRCPDSFYRGNCNGGGSSSESAAVGNTSEDAENQNSDETDGGESGSSNSVEQAQSANAASAGATATVKPGIYVPTSIGIGTNINVSTPDPGVATYVGRDMYIGGKPSDKPSDGTIDLDADNAPTG